MHLATMSEDAKRQCEFNYRNKRSKRQGLFYYFEIFFWSKILENLCFW